MAKKPIKVYWLLLTVVLALAATVLSVNPSQARFENTVAWTTVLTEGKAAVTSDWLQPISDPATTILLGEMPLEGEQVGTLVEFTLQSSADTTGVLKYSVKMEHVPYMQIQMEPSGPVTLEKGKPVTVQMRLLPTQQTLGTVHEAMEVPVQISWESSLQGDFLVEIPARTQAQIDAAKPAEPIVPSDPTVPTEPDTQPEQGGEGEEDPTEPTTPEAQDVSTEEPADQGGAAASGSGIMPRTGSVAAEPEPQTATEPQTVTEEGENEDNKLILHTPKSVSAKTILPLKLEIGKSVTSAQIGLTNEAQNLIDVFPSRTRFSLNNGSTYYKFYQEGLIEIDNQDAEALRTVNIQLDLSETDAASNKALYLGVQGHSAMIEKPFMHTLIGDMESARVEGSQILSLENPVRVSLPEEWQDYPMTYTVRRVILKDGENDTTVKSYESVPVFLAELRDETVAETPETETTETQAAETQATEPQEPELPPMGSLVMTPVITAEGLRQMEFSAADSQLPAGTYVMELTWEYEGITFGHTRVTFFVNFVQHPNTAQQTAESAQEEETEMIDTETKQTGGAEQ